MEDTNKIREEVEALTERPENGVQDFCSGDKPQTYLIMLANAVNQKTRQTEEKIADTKSEIAAIAVAEEALAKMEALLREMRDYAARAAVAADGEREELNILFQAKKKELDEIIAAFYAG